MADQIESSSSNEIKEIEDDNKSPSKSNEKIGIVVDTLESLRRPKLIQEASVLSVLWEWLHRAMECVYFKNYRALALKRTADLSRKNSTKYWSEQGFALLIPVMVFTAGGVYAVVLSFRAVFPISAADQVNIVNLSFVELFTLPRATTNDFSFYAAATVTFMTSMVVIMSAVCSILSKWTSKTHLTMFSLFTIGSFSLSFFAMLSKLVPHSVTIAGGSLKIPAVLIVVLYSIYVIFVLYALIFIAKGLWSFWCKQHADVVSTMEA